MTRPSLVLIGGFLGAGKTTLILAAAQLLQKRGMRVAAIMNDQDRGLVDTRFVTASNITAREVSGGCFCCRFSDLLEAAGALRAYDPAVIFAEPVGSCIDISATIIHPLKTYHPGTYKVAPLTVLFDPALATQVFNGRADPDTEYLFRNQIAEADIVCSTKSDLHRTPDLPFPTDFSLSAKTGNNVAKWLDELLSGARISGSQLLQVDYSRYADAEAALGWLNLHARIHLNSPLSPMMLAGPLLDSLEQRLTQAGVRIAHLKVFDSAPSGFIKASLCGNGYPIEADGDLLADPAVEHELAINLRAIAEPAQLSSIVSDAIAEIAGAIKILHQSSFRPAPPKPEHRFSSIY